ncbi:MAG: glycosyltransferase family 4 protein [Xanthomonadales bacterium]|nr:glycosyltransferase family 4 protein [Xanthomonadales bacterium]
MNLSSAALAAFAASFVLTGCTTWYARRRGLLDHPGERHSHAEATPRGGGAGLLSAFLLTALWLTAGADSSDWLIGVMPGVIVIAIVGAWDDHSSLSVRLRFFIQLAVSFYLLGYAANAEWVHGALEMIVCCLFLVWMTNLYNFMDGSNGMAGLQGVFGGALLGWLFYQAGDAPFSAISILLAASCAGFLPWNLGRARVFMGDVGSLALGFLFGSLLIYGVGTGAFTIPVALMIMLLFLTDSTLTLLGRVLKGERWYTAHRQHLYQRMIANGWTHGSVATFYQAVNLALVVPGIVVAVHFPALAWVAALALTLIFVLGWYLLVRRFGVPAQAG